MSDSFSESIMVPDWPAPANVKALISTRNGGVSAPPYDSFNLGLHVGDDEKSVNENRQLLSKTAGENVACQWVSQVHDNHVIDVQKELVDEKTPADAIYTQRDNVACGVLTADCLSVLFTDVAGREIAVAHAGWRGLAAGVLQKTLEHFSADPVSIMAYLGPVIGPCHFEVGNDVRQAFQTLELTEIENQLPVLFQESETPGRWMADLYAIARIILASKGILQVYGEPLCTYCEFDQYYSYRREGETGRFASVIWKESD